MGTITRHNLFCPQVSKLLSFWKLNKKAFQQKYNSVCCIMLLNDALKFRDVSPRAQVYSPPYGKRPEISKDLIQFSPFYSIYS